MRDMRTVNMSTGQKAESKKVFKRIGDLAYRDISILGKIGLFDSGKMLITKGLLVTPSSGMTVQVGLGAGIQRLGSSGDLLPFLQTTDQTVTLDAASGVARTDIIEAQVRSVTAKDDYADLIIDPDTGSISTTAIKRDIQYFLSVQKKTGSTTPTAAIAGVLTGTASIPTTVDLSARYLINIADGEDGSFQEVDLRGATPEVTTKAEIVAHINSAVGRVMASISGNYVVLTGNGLGETSYFELKPPITNSGLDAIDLVFGLSGGGVYSYTYQGTNDWVKIAEIAVGSATTVIIANMIKDVSQTESWVSESENILLRDPIFDSFDNKPILPCDNSSINESQEAFRRVQKLLYESIDSGSVFSNKIQCVSTYALAYTTLSAYYGGVLAPDGSIHFVPSSASRGQKISASGVVSTYALAYTTSSAYYGGVLAPDGSIHFVPNFAPVGQKITTTQIKSWPQGLCLHSFFNKF